MSITINGSTGILFPDSTTQVSAPVKIPAGTSITYAGTSAPTGS